MKHNDSSAEVIDLLTHKRSPDGERLTLADGATAVVEDGGLALRDRQGRLLIRWQDGAAEIAAPSGDLVLSSPEGRVVLRSGLDIAIEAGRDVTQRAARELEIAVGRESAQLRIGPQALEIESDRVEVQTKSASLVSGAISSVARVVSSRAESIAVTTEKYELTATRLFEKSRDAFRDVVDLAQTRVGRAKTTIAKVWSVSAGRTVLVSKEETSIDGKKILLG